MLQTFTSDITPVIDMNLDVENSSAKGRWKEIIIQNNRFYCHHTDPFQ